MKIEFSYVSSSRGKSERLDSDLSNLQVNETPLILAPQGSVLGREEFWMLGGLSKTEKNFGAQSPALLTLKQPLKAMLLGLL